MNNSFICDVHPNTDISALFDWFGEGSLPVPVRVEMSSYIRFKSSSVTLTRIHGKIRRRLLGSQQQRPSEFLSSLSEVPLWQSIFEILRVRTKSCSLQSYSLTFSVYGCKCPHDSSGIRWTLKNDDYRPYTVAPEKVESVNAATCFYRRPIVTCSLDNLSLINFPFGCLKNLKR